MQPAYELEHLYHSTNANTLALWQAFEGAGNPIPEYYSPRKLALATGFQPRMSGQIKTLFSELEILTRHDPLVDLQSASGFHFTFVPLTLPLYEEHAPVPVKAHQLADAWAPYAGKRICIEALRLVALPGQLLLAGLPGGPAAALRQAFCDAVLKTEWKAELLDRHAKTPLPAPFWHTTLLRYQAERLPSYLRAYFIARQSQRYGGVSGDLKLARINYNWTRCFLFQP